MSLKLRFSGLLSFLWIVLFVLSGCQHGEKSGEIVRHNSLYSALDEYGYSNQDQRQSLTYLLTLAGIVPEGKDFPDKFPDRSNPLDFQKDVLQFIKLTQENFTVRKGTQERWEIQAADWMRNNKTQIRQAVRNLGFVDEILPEREQVDAVCVLGSTYPSMIRRLKFVAQLVDQGKLKTRYIILVTGERPAKVGVDGSREELVEVARRANLSSVKALMETDLMKQAFEDSTLKGRFKLFVIDTPAGNLPRPTTETTVVKLIDWLKSNTDIKHIVFVSNQPQVKYQRAIIESVFKDKNCTVPFEIIGERAKLEIDVMELVGTVGSHLWAKTPMVLRGKGAKIQDPQLRAEFTSLYSKQAHIMGVMAPLLYK